MSLEMPTEHLERFAEMVAEVTARRIANEQGVQLTELSIKTEKILTTLFNGGAGGLVQQVAEMKRSSENRKMDCDTKFNAIRSLAQTPTKEVNTWKQRIIGAGAVIGIFGTAILGLLALHQYLK